MSALALLAAYLILINALAFAAMAADKARAITGRARLPERSLLLLAAIGGGPGAIAAQQILHHKTRKEPFRSILWGIAVAQVLALMLLLSR